MQRTDPISTDPTCAECAHARIAGDVLNKRICGRYPPSVFPVQDPRSGNLAAVAMRPEVNTSDRACGEFKPRH